MNHKKITDIIEKETLVDLLRSFSNVTGFMTKIVGPEGELLIPPVEVSDYCKMVRGAVECKISNNEMTQKALETGKAELYYCHLNIWHFAAPIVLNDVHYGTIIGGQFLIEEPCMDRVKSHADEFNIPFSVLENKIKAVPYGVKRTAMLAGEVLHSIASSIGKLCLENQKFLSIFDASKAFSSMEDKGKIMDLVMDLSCVFGKADFGKVFLWDGKKLNLERIFYNGKSQKCANPKCSHANTFLPKSVLEKKDIIYGCKGNKGYSKYKVSLSEETETFISFPLTAGQNVCGVIQLEHKAKKIYTSYEQDILRILGAHGGLAVRNVENISSQHDLIYFDGLTNIYNRRYLDDALKNEIKRSSRHKREFAVMFMDIDNFKSVNDNYGHKQGDEVLMEFTRRVKSRIRDVNIFGRYGGEEFVLIIPECTLKDAKRIACRILKKIRQPSFKTMDALIPVTASIGISLFPKHCVNPEDLLHMADVAMYTAKKLGKDRYAVFAEEKTEQGVCSC